MLLDRQKVRQDLRWMKFVRQAIPNRYASVLCQFLDRLMRKPTKLDTIKHPSEHFRRIFDGFFFAELDIVFAEIFRRNAEVVCCHRKGATRARTGFFKQ